VRSKGKLKALYSKILRLLVILGPNLNADRLACIPLECEPITVMQWIRDSAAHHVAEEQTTDSISPSPAHASLNEASTIII
jgi:hypothetical protein